MLIVLAAVCDGANCDSAHLKILSDGYVTHQLRGGLVLAAAIGGLMLVAVRA